MGLFSRRKTVYGTSVSPLIEEKNLPDSMKTSVLRSLLDAQGISLDEHVLDEFSDSLALTSQRYYQRGKANYTRGLPHSTRLTKTTGIDEVTAVLEAIEGATVFIDYSFVSAPNMHHRTWMHLIDNYGYSQTTNILGSLGAPNKYLENFQLKLPASEIDSYDIGVLDMPGPTSDAGYAPGRRAGQAVDTLEDGENQVIQFWASATEEVTMTYRWGAGPTYNFASTTFALSTVDEEADYFHVRYTVGGVIKYWLYKIGAGTHTTLDTFLETSVVESGYFPIAYFRKNKVSLVSNPASVDYISTKKLLDVIGIDFQELGDSIHESPDIADVDTAMLVFAADVESTHPAVIRYLFDYFTKWYIDVGGTFTGGFSVFGTGSGMESVYDGLSRTTYSVQDIERSVISGVISAVGEYTASTIATSENIDYIDDVGTPAVRVVPIFWRVYRYQVSADTYYEVKVKNLNVYYHILGARVRATEDNNNILIPLDRTIIEDYNLADREQLYARGLHMVFNCYEIIKLAWYETGFFKFLMLAAALVITVLSFGKSFKLILLAMAVGSIPFFLAVVLIELIMNWLVAKAMELVVKELGLENALIAALVAAVVSGKIASMNPGLLMKTPWGQELLSLSTNLAKAVSTVSKDLMGDLRIEGANWQTQKEQQEKKLEKARDLLDTSTPYLVPMLLPNETPDGFYTRTIHSGNIGVTGLKAIHSYVANALALPTIEETRGGYTYG